MKHKTQSVTAFLCLKPSKEKKTAPLPSNRSYIKIEKTEGAKSKVKTTTTVMKLKPWKCKRLNYIIIINIII
jgi:hypothetical protein